MAAQLKAQSFQEAESIAQALINMGVYENIEAYLALFQEPNVLFILKAAHNLARQQNNSNNIELAVERASKIVFSLKSYAHFEHSEKMVESSITENIDVVLTLYQNQLKQGIKVIMHYEEVPMITCYPDDLNQVWVNIIHNAIQAMDVKGTLTIEVAKKSPYIAVNITDSGTGIPEEIKERIFEPFFTTKPRGEGSGLGLDIVRKVIEKHQGHINVTSQPGKTTFSVLLPM
jgi:signal transduction histidine kinase